MRHVLIILLLLLGVQVSAQEEFLILEKEGKSKVKYFSEGKRIKVKTDKGEVYKGRTSFDDGKLFVDGHEVDLDKLQHIRTKSLASYITGGVLGGVGGVATVVGTIILIEGLREPDACAGTLLVLISIPFIAAGVIVFLVPATLFLTVGRRHRASKWNYRVGPKIPAAEDDLERVQRFAPSDLDLF